MKRILVFTLCLFLLIPSAIAESKLKPGSMGEYTLEPGIYEIGVDIPAGYYDIRIKGLDLYCLIRVSQYMFEGQLDTSKDYSFTFTFASPNNYWQGCHPNILLTESTYLQIENSPCVFYPISRSDF